MWWGSVMPSSFKITCRTMNNVCKLRRTSSALAYSRPDSAALPSSVVAARSVGRKGAKARWNRCANVASMTSRNDCGV
eukprot:453191-Lingulodinium_polyedra.AAC.1